VCTDRTPVSLTPVYENKAVRYADGEFDDRFNRVIVVREGKLHRGSCRLTGAEKIAVCVGLLI
jgi:hypothetical protein